MGLIIYANGCSMTYGFELKDDPETGRCLDDAYREAHAWPGRLGDLLDAGSVVNDAVVSGSNDRILRTTTKWVLDHVESGSPEQAFVVVGWSGAMRREFFADGAYHQVIPYQKPPTESLADLVNAYREVAWHDIECGSRLATQIVALQSFLVSHGIAYCFFDAIESSYDALGRAGLSDSSYLREIDRSRFLGFEAPDGCMADALRAAGTSWNGRHPAEDGHELWATKLAGFIVAHQLLRRPRPPEAATRAVGPAFPGERRVFRRPNTDFIYP